MGGQHNISSKDTRPVYELINSIGVNDVTVDGVWGLHIVGNIYNPEKNFYLSRISIKCWRLGGGLISIFSIYNVDVNHYPIGSSLAQATKNYSDIPTAPPYNYHNWNFLKPAFLYKDTEYAFVLTVPLGDSGHKLNWRQDSEFALYPRGGTLFSTDGGATWLYGQIGNMTFKVYW